MGHIFDDLKAANACFNNWTKTVIKGNEGQTYDHVVQDRHSDRQRVRQQLPRTNARLPPFVLLEALDRAQTIRWLGEDEFSGRKQKGFASKLSI